MPRLTFGGVELQRPEDNYEVYFEFSDGGPSDYTYEVRGDDTVIPGKDGQMVRDRKADHLGIVLVGWVEGQGSTHTAKREDYVALMSVLGAVLDPVLDPQELIAYPPVDGVPDPRMLLARFLRKTGPTKTGEYFRRMTLYFECIDDPPVWVPGS
jgi:hypothetical protein